MRLSNKVALIDGASSGIGRATALLFAKEGAKIQISDIMVPGGLETVNMIKTAGGDASFVEVDATTAAGALTAVEAAVKNYGRVDILVNIVGGGLGMGSFEDTDETKFDKIVALNFKTVFLFVKAALPELKKTKGCIVNVGSMSAFRPRPGVTIYASCKGAVNTFTKVVAQELAPYGIRMNVINPAMTATERALKNPKDIMDQMAAEIPLKRLGKPEDMANAILYLASDESSFLTGDAINVDGGDGI